MLQELNKTEKMAFFTWSRNFIGPYTHRVSLGEVWLSGCAYPNEGQDRTGIQEYGNDLVVFLHPL
jgi:hypothetical protein